MHYFRKIHFNNLSIIQEKIFNYFPLHKLKEQSLFYLPNNIKIFLSIEELYSQLFNLNLIHNVESIAFYSLPSKQTSPIHVDTGVFNYSLNIPIKNCLNTKVNFYKNNKNPTLIKTGNISYLRCDPTDCVVVNSLELDTPCIVNVKEPHSIINTNTETRITLLIRLQHFYQENFNKLV